MYSVTKIVDFCYGHRILGHEGKCGHPHGHNGRIEIEVAATELNDLGMVVDFADVKRIVATWVEAHLDHRMILQNSDPLLEWLNEQEEPVHVLDCPPTAENIARVIFEAARDAGLPIRSVRLWAPDAVIEIGGDPFALEVECVQKTDERYRDIFWRYQEDSTLAGCLYVADESLLNTLMEQARDFPRIYFTSTAELFEKKEKAAFRNAGGQCFDIEANLEKNLEIAPSS